MCFVSDIIDTERIIQIKKFAAAPGKGFCFAATVIESGYYHHVNYGPFMREELPVIRRMCCLHHPPPPTPHVAGGCAGECFGGISEGSFKGIKLQS